MGFVWTGTSWRYQSNTELSLDPITITPTTLDNTGSPQQVQWCEANDARRTLGAHISPDGSMARQLEILYDHFSAWKQCLGQIKSTNLHAKWLSYMTFFLKKVLYPLIGHSFTEADLQCLQRSIDREALHLLCLNEHFPRSILHGPLLYGGLGCAPIHAQHVVDKLLLFVHHMREGGKTKER